LIAFHLKHAKRRQDMLVALENIKARLGLLEGG